MPSLLSYLEDWWDSVGRGIRSYADVMGELRESRYYHRRRSTESPADVEADDLAPRVEIPLLWGKF